MEKKDRESEMINATKTVLKKLINWQSDERKLFAV